MTAFLALFRRDLLVALRRPTDAANPLVFFVLAVLLLGVGAGSAERGLGDSAAGAVWVLALFANLLAVEGVFRRDFEDGTLEQLLIHARPRFAAVLGKLAANWSCAGLPVLVLSPLALFVLGHSTAGAGMVMLTLLLGTPTLTLLGAIGAALTAGTGPWRSAVGGLGHAVLPAGADFWCRREHVRGRRAGCGVRTAVPGCPLDRLDPAHGGAVRGRQGLGDQPGVLNSRPFAGVSARCCANLTFEVPREEQDA